MGMKGRGQKGTIKGFGEHGLNSTHRSWTHRPPRIDLVVMALERKRDVWAGMPISCLLFSTIFKMIPTYLLEYSAGIAGGQGRWLLCTVPAGVHKSCRY